MQTNSICQHIFDEYQHNPPQQNQNDRIEIVIKNVFGGYLPSTYRCSMQTEFKSNTKLIQIPLDLIYLGM